MNGSGRHYFADRTRTRPQFDVGTADDPAADPVAVVDIAAGSYPCTFVELYEAGGWGGVETDWYQFVPPALVPAGEGVLRLANRDSGATSGTTAR